MKNILKKVLSIAAATALLMTSVISASADDPAAGHSHGGGTKITDTTGCDYTITLTHPGGEAFADSKSDGTGSHYGAYQIFSGTVKGESYTGADGANDSNPGSNSVAIPITDIKWGNAFGVVGIDDSTRNINILGFVYALSQAKEGSYSFAFKDFDGFDGYFTNIAGSQQSTLNTSYCKDKDTTVTVTYNDKGVVTAVDNVKNVNFDKLAVTVAEVLVAHNNHEWLQAFNDILGGYAQGTDGYENKGFVNRFYEGEINKDENTKYEIKVPAGYYMIRDLSSIDGASKSYSARMLFVANNVNQVLKESVPKLDKKILRGDTTVGSVGNETEVAGVGDVVHFQLDGTLPSNYELYLGGYQYKFVDTLSEGLDLVQYDDDHADYSTDANDCVKVTVNGLYEWDTSENDWVWNSEKSIELSHDWTAVTAPEGATVTDHHLGNDEASGEKKYNYNATYTGTTGDPARTLTIEFPCLREIRIENDSKVYRLGYDKDDTTDDDGNVTELGSSKIYVDYYAKVNSAAKVLPKDGANMNGNTNTATLTYSDNPQSYGDTDTTTQDIATVYTFGLDITKIDAATFIKGDGDDITLPGAQFAILREVEGSPNTYEYATVTGSYAILSWSTDTILGNNGDALRTALKDKSGILMTTDGSGKLNITGLDAGVEYTLVEITTPGTAGQYALIEPITFTINAATETPSSEYTGKIDDIEKKAGFTDADGSLSLSQSVAKNGVNADNGGIEDFTVVNFKYTDLPSTGGIGVYIYYIAGGCVVALALVLFALSKKKKTTK